MSLPRASNPLSVDQIAASGVSTAKEENYGDQLGRVERNGLIRLGSIIFFAVARIRYFADAIKFLHG